MNKTIRNAGPVRGGKAAAPAKKSLAMPAMILGVIIIGSVIGYKSIETPPPPPPPLPSAQDILKPQTVMAHQDVAPPSDLSPPADFGTAVDPAAPAPDHETAIRKRFAYRVLGEPTPYSRTLVSSLAQLDIKGPITADQAQRWKDNLKLLVQQGSSSVAGIQEFLAQNKDTNYAGVSGSEQLGFSSLRSAMIDALQQIGGEDATSALVQTMSTSPYPSDIASVAKYLEQQAPGQYSQEILDAARQGLASAADNQMPGTDVGALFKLIAANGGPDAANQIQQLGAKWSFYEGITLANLPDGAGVPALAQIASGASPGNSQLALEGLAQQATQSPQAMNDLLEMAKGGKLSDWTLTRLAPYLGGEINTLNTPTTPVLEMTGQHIANGNQNSVSYLDPNLPADQIAPREELINQILKTIPSNDQSGRAALEKSLLNLQNLPQGKAK